jgi:hypothetical protein
VVAFSHGLDDCIVFDAVLTAFGIHDGLSAPVGAVISVVIVGEYSLLRAPVGITNSGNTIWWIIILTLIGPVFLWAAGECIARLAKRMARQEALGGSCGCAVDAQIYLNVRAFLMLMPRE